MHHKVKIAIDNYKLEIGNKFNHLTVLDIVYYPNKKSRAKYQFKVQCDCGAITFKRASDVIDGTKIKTCGINECKHRKSLLGHLYKCSIDKYKQYVGQKFGYLTIIDVIYDETTHVKYKFKLQCDCGNNTISTCDSILNGGVYTCGHDCKYSYHNTAKYKQYIGQKIGSLTVINSQFSELKKRHMFKCQCDCGNSNFNTDAYYLITKLSPTSCIKCNSSSKFELMFKNFLNELSLEYQKKLIPSKLDIQQLVEIDFLLEEYNVGIELHGLTIHATTKVNHDNYFIGNKPKLYHLNKTESCKDQGIDLIQFWNIELIHKFDICKSIILNRIGKTPYKSYARKCEVREIDKKTYDDFMETHHLQGTTRGESVRLGLFYKENDSIVSCMSFGHSRYGNHQWEMFRFATHIYCQVVGAASKLFKYFVRNWKPDNIVSYSDRRVFNSGGLYKTLGFKHSHDSDPNYWYFKNHFDDYRHSIYHRSTFMKHKLKDKLEIFNSNLSEWENMEMNNYLRIYDCGNTVYAWNTLY